MIYVYYLLEIVDALALLLVLILLLRGPFRKFWPVLGYALWELLSNAALTSFSIFNAGALTGANMQAGRLYARLYWANDVIVDLLRFLLVIMLTYKATAGGARRVFNGRILGGIAVAALVLPFMLFPIGISGPKGTAWLTSTSELLNFGAAIMNLVLWGVLLADRKRDPQLAVVSVGLGVVVTGAAISYGLRRFVPIEARFIPNIFLMLTELAGWAIWCRAFWPAQARGPAFDPTPSNAMPPA